MTVSHTVDTENCFSQCSYGHKLNTKADLDSFHYIWKQLGSEDVPPCGISNIMELLDHVSGMSSGGR
jgi:hypothetical protein